MSASPIRIRCNLADDPETPPPARSADPGHDYLLALAAAAGARLVSGDHHVLDLAPELPIESPADLLARLEGARD